MANSLVIVPEIVLLDGIQKLLKIIKLDYESLPNDQKNKSLLYRLFTDLRIERYAFFDQAVKVFITKEDNPRKIEADLMFNMKRDGLPTIHLSLPSEQAGQNPISNGENYQQILEDDILDPETGEVIVYRGTPVFTRRFRATYNIVITSDNSTETVLIYTVIKSLFISLHNHFSLAGLENMSFGGGDLNINSELIPKNIFMRSFNVSLEYMTSSPSLHKYILPQGIEVESTPVPDISSFTEILGDENNEPLQDETDESLTT